MEKIKLSESDKEALRGVKKMIEEMCGCADMQTETRVREPEMNVMVNRRKKIGANFDDMPTLSQLCKIAGINKDKLKKGFKYLFSITIYQYHLHLKMTVAKELLLSTNDTISSIAFQLRYHHSCSFCTAFKNYTGISAFQFRSQPPS